jgi:hypothetical protein
MKAAKRMAFLCALLLVCNCAFAQSQISEPSQDPTASFRLFRTTNNWTLIELETSTGRMWQIQFDVSGDNRGGVVLNSQDLAMGKDKHPGRFTLYPTSNMYTFILLDQIDGATWQVQWAIEAKNRFVLPIAD